MGVWNTLLLITLCWSSVFAMDCPSSCRCSGFRVDCSNSELTSVPKLPIETQELDLSGNSIKVLGNKSFTSILKSIDLSRNGLLRIEINAFEDLRELKQLNLSHNTLNADDFKDQELFRGCREVTELDVSYNSLTRIPDEGFQLLTRLVSLHLSNNQMTDPTFGTEFVSLDELEYIDLSGNNFAEVPAHSFKVLKEVKTLNLSRCGIRSIQSEVFRHINNLVHFDISDNEEINQHDLNATIQVVCNSASITTLRLSNVNISDLRYVLTPLLDAEDLELLDLSKNNLAQLKDADLRPAKRLKELDLSYNKLTSLPSLSLPRLIRLDVSHNSLTSIQEQNFDGATQLKEIHLSHNQLTEFSSNPFSRNSELIELYMSSNRIRTVLPLWQLESLLKLDLSNNLIEDPTELFLLYDMKELDISNNKISRLEKSMIPDSTLVHLNLSGNSINYIETDTFTKWNPQVIDLSHNRLTSIDQWGLNIVGQLYLQSNSISYISDDSLKLLSRLENLNLSDNRLERLPAIMFSYLIDLDWLDLSNNELAEFLEGPVGSTFFSSPQPIRLRSLSLSSNNLRIIRPNYFSNLTVLEHLDLSRNDLTDINSRQFGELDILRSLNISHNKLISFNYTAISSLVSLRSLDLTGTQWQCDCTLTDTLKWMEKTEINIVGYDEYRCSAPHPKVDTLLTDYSQEDTSCTIETVMEKTIIIIIIGCTSFVILVVAAIVFWQHRWRLKKKLKKQHYRAMYERAQMPLPNNNGVATTQTEYHHHHHPHNHHSHTHTAHKSVPPCAEHGHGGQAFV